MFISLLPDTNVFNKTREWSEVRNALTSLGEDVSVVKIPNSKSFSGEVGLFDTYRCLLDSTKEDADNTTAFLELNKIEVVRSQNAIDQDDYVYDWRANVLWVGRQNDDITRFYSRSNVEVKVLQTEKPLRSCIVVGYNGDCVIDPSNFSDAQIVDLERRYSAVEVRDDLRGIILADKGFCFDHDVSTDTQSKLKTRYDRCVRAELIATGRRLNTVVTPVIA